MAAEIFPHLFNPQDLGKSLREVSQSVVKTSRPDVVSRWFHSAKDADLFIWMDLNRIIFKQQVSFYGQVVEWNAIEGVKTGHVMVEEEGRGAKRSEVLHFDEVPQTRAIEQAIALLGFVIELHESERHVLAENFRRMETSQNMPAEEMIARFGEFLGHPVASAAEPKAWKRLVARFLGLFKV